MSSVLHTPTVCIKIGGNALKETSALNHFIEDCSAIRSKTRELIIVHGGGPAIADILDRYEIPHEFIGGHRKTTSRAIGLVEMALKGGVGGSIVRGLIGRGFKAAGLSGVDGPTVFSDKRYHRQQTDERPEKIDLGQVGDVRHVDTTLLKTLLQSDIVPVLAPLALAPDGSVHNINADMFAGHIAGALKADLFFLMTDVDGFRLDKNDPGSLVADIDIQKEWPRLAPLLEGGMIPKMEAARLSLQKGVGRVAILNGTKRGILPCYLDGEKYGTTLR